MKIKLFKASAFLCMLFLITVFLLGITTTPAKANGLEVVGSDIGLEVTPHDQNLFNELNLNPGDYKESHITIKNTNKVEFELFLQVKRLDEIPSLKNPDLFKQLIVTVSLGDKVIYKGPMIAFATGENGISLGNFKPGDVQDMKLLINLPGAETGNEYMGLTHKNQWVFTAKSKSGGDLPKTGEKYNHGFFIITGLLLISLGILTFYKSRAIEKKTKCL